MSRRLRILLVAYQCGSGEGSVSQIGWEWFERLAKRVKVTLVTHVRNTKAILRSGLPAPDAEVIYVNTEAFAGPLYRTASLLFPRSQHAVFLISSLDFYYFDRKAVRILSKMQKLGHHWDLVHMVTPVSPVAIPSLHRLGMPVILGPWNGGLESPTTFPEFMKQDSAWMYPVRHLGNLFEWINGGLAGSARILTATLSTDRAIPSNHRSKCVRVLENGVDLSLFEATAWPSAPSRKDLLRILFVGRLLPMKGVPMLLEALKVLSSSTPCDLTIIGDGPERALLEKQTEELGLRANVHFLGARPLSEVSAAMRDAHVFCLPSVRESGGAVLLEAMAAARPVVAIKYGGPAEVVTDEVGRAIEPVGREYVVKELLATFQEIVKHPDSWRRKGVAGRRRAESEFGWEAKVNRTMELYARLVNREQSANAARTQPGTSSAADENERLVHSYLEVK